MASQELSTPDELPETALLPIDGAKDFPDEPPNFGETPTFGRLTLLFDAIQTERKQERRRMILQKWFSVWRQSVGPNLYPVLRLILPQKDRERSVYHCKEANIAKALIAVMGIEKTPDAGHLLNWKRPSTNQKSAAGDFPGLAYEIISKRSSITEGGTLRIDQLNDLLDELSKRGSKLQVNANIASQHQANRLSSDHQKRIFSQLFSHCAASEIRWIIRIVLKDLNVGVKETTVLSVFHPDALAIFNSSSDLKRVAYELWNPAKHAEEIEKSIRMFRSFAPMLSKRPPRNLGDAVKKFKGATFKVEEKLDGERIQLHKRGDLYFYCSRKGKDYTYLYGKTREEGSLTPFIHSSFHPGVRECILDGEMLVWDPVSERYLPFGTLKSHAGETAPNRDYSPRPCFKVFDLLYLNRGSLTDKPMASRRRNLETLFLPVDGRFEIVQQHEATTLSDVQKLLRETVENRGEGLILKHPLSIYLLNGRNDFWVKIKPEYMEGDGETFDLLVVGGNYGSGSRGGGVSTLICAVRDDRPSAAGGDRKYCSFARIGSGLSFADFITIRAKPWKEWGSKGPSFLQTAPRSHDDKGDVYLNPEDSFIVTVKAAEITESDQYHLRLTLRFPRAVRIREEATAEDTATASEIFEHIASGKKRKQEEEARGPNKKRRIGGRKKALVSAAFQATHDPSQPPSEWKLFSGKTFVVYSTTKATVPYNKPEIEKSIRANGGVTRSRRSQNKGEILIYGGANAPMDIKKIMDENEQYLVYPQWILDCVKKQTLLPLRTKYLRFAAANHDADTEDEEEEEADVINAFKTGEERANHAQDEENSRMGIDGSPAEYTMEELEARAHSEWIKVEPQDSFDLGALARDLSDDEITDHEDPDDEDEEGVTGSENWVDLFETTNTGDNPQGNTTSTPATMMGETNIAAEYDPDNVFRHLVFYLDSPTCARRNGMRVSTANEQAIEAEFIEVANKIMSNGGKITPELTEPKLTHILVHNDDLSRRKELIRLTYGPRLRRVVIMEWIDACLAPENMTLLNEEDFIA